MKRLTLIAVVVVAAIVPTFANAKTIPYLSQGQGVHAEDFGGSASKAQQRVEIPYLSQGKGVTSGELFGVGADDRTFADTRYELGPGEIPYLTENRVEIPYLSQGVGVTSGELLGVSSDDRPYSRVPTVDATPAVASSSDKSGVDFGNGAAISLVLMLGLFAGGTAVAIWNSRRGKLSPA